MSRRLPANEQSHRPDVHVYHRFRLRQRARTASGKNKTIIRQYYEQRQYVNAHRSNNQARVSPSTAQTNKEQTTTPQIRYGPTGALPRRHGSKQPTIPVLPAKHAAATTSTTTTLPNLTPPTIPKHCPHHSFQYPRPNQRRLRHGQFHLAFASRRQQ